MVVKTHICKTLKKLERKYNSTILSSDVNEPIYYCKLATLEYCGWIELTFDDIINRSLKEKLHTRKFKRILEKQVIGKTYGFQYEDHFRPMLISAVGLQRAEEIEVSLDQLGLTDTLKSELSTMKVYRNQAAHTWIQNTTQSFPTPTNIIQKFDAVYPILRKLYSEVM